MEVAPAALPQLPADVYNCILAYFISAPRLLRVMRSDTGSRCLFLMVLLQTGEQALEDAD
jgi:hypothetical protein